MPNVRVAVVQAEPPPSLALGLDNASSLIAECAGQGATLIAFPETWLPGYPIWLDVSADVALWDHGPVKTVYRRMANDSVVVPSASTERLGSAGRDHGVTVVIGSIE